MKQAGQIVVFHFPHTDLEEGKLRPALLLSKLPGEYDDCLICMVSSQSRQYIAGFDEIIKKATTTLVKADWRFQVFFLLGGWQLFPEKFFLVQSVKYQMNDWLESKRI